MNSSYWAFVARKCEREQKEYENLKKQISSVLPYFDQVAEYLKNSSNCLKEVIINGNAFDDKTGSGKGELSMMADEILGIKANFEVMLKECSDKSLEKGREATNAWNNYHMALKNESSLEENKKN